MPACWMPQPGRIGVAGQLGDLNEERVLFLVAPGFPWVAVQWGIWRAGGIAVPLPLGSPAAELEYFIDDTQAETLLRMPPGQSYLRRLRRHAGCAMLSCDESRCRPSEADRCPRSTASDAR